MGIVTRAIDFLGLRRSMMGLLGMVILIGMGERMAERFLPIYLLALGGGEFAVGLLNGLTNLLGALYSFPGGYLSDRIGAKRALLVFNLLTMAGFLVVILVPSWLAVIGGSFLFLSWTAISLPATMGLVARVLPQNRRTMGVSMHSLVRRVPMALGPLAGGLFIAQWGERDGVRLAFAAALAMAFAAIVMQQRLIEPDAPKPSHAPGPHKNPLAVLARMSPPLRSLLVSDILIRFCEQIPYAFVVVWCMKTIEHPVSAFQFGILTSIEMTTAVLCYIPVAYFADRGGKKPFIAMTFVFFTLFPLLLLFCRSFAWLAGAFVLRGLKEFGEPTRKALIMDLAPDDAKAATFGAYYLARDVVVSIAAFGGLYLWKIAPEANLIAAFSFGVLGTVWFVLCGKDAG
ncbi:MAG TPA: MFS transporter [Candidatus Hydrogenedentes bacterium]|nr:MFS transporter [Candidatus Hydrogenedentota bacterium]HOV73239.1 MFS transporter [Candidatus Hydrogenedentota bacterium]HPC17465.1 MFS transporter [Candidatus Hydrogenedentota bacterium]HRT20057.1 MFS transporter [Candidatus Hydrogenedentota bacterium]HRT64879.1 MFS transporter [Candidatus Hydrogenedentota bacterium]